MARSAKNNGATVGFEEKLWAADAKAGVAVMDGDNAED
jgi:hypothetical protein